MNKIKPYLFVFLVVASEPLYAYIGPGMAGGAIAAIFGVICALFLALIGILYYPIKRAIKNRKSKAAKNNEKVKPDEDLQILIDHILLSLLCVIAVEIFVRFNLPQCVSIIFAALDKARMVILSDRISDHWKEKAIPAYSVSLLTNSSKILMIFVSILLFFLVFSFFSPSLTDLALSPFGIAESIIVAYLFVVVRKRLYE